MKYLFLLSGDYADLAKEEAISLLGIKNSKLADKILIADLENNEKFVRKSFKRLALTKSIYKCLFECKADELIKALENFDWNSTYKDSFCLRMHYFDNNKKIFNIKNPLKNKLDKKNNQKKLSNASELRFTRSQLTEKNLAVYIWSSLINPKVDLKNPKTKIELFFNKDKVYCGLLIYENKENFESRKAHLRPFPHPSSLHPKLARALVNIAGIKENEILLDPFCGTGGFLIEAGLMGMQAVGCDISRSMANGCKENLEYFKVKNYKIFNANALKVPRRFDCVVTDLPYGLNSNVYLQYSKNSLKQKSNKINLKLNEKFSIPKIENFYFKFLKMLRKKLKRKAVIIFPSFVDCESIIKRAGFGIEKVMSVYVHRSLTRKITKISPN